MPPVLAIIGRPNVGKSALFNRIVGRRIAIVHDQPGVTRDRVIASADWNGRSFQLIDTGGIGLAHGEKSTDVIQIAALQQVDLALEAADALLLVVNVREGVVPLDLEVAKKLRATRKPVVVAANKADHDSAENGAPEFAALGFDKIIPTSAIHGLGIDNLLEAAMGLVPNETDQDKTVAGTERPAKPIRLAIVGRPNVGKSSLINSLTGSDRVVVSPIPGTTRDAVDVPFRADIEGTQQDYVLIDTAGVRKARRISESVEFFSVERTKEAITRCDIAILILDAESGILEQDKKIADFITEARRACILVVNKWDLVADAVKAEREEEIRRRREKDRPRDDREKRMTTLSEFGEWVQSRLFFLDYAPVIFTSATEGFQLERLLDAIGYVATQLNQTVPTAILNRTLRDAIEKRQPVSRQGVRLKFFYATQVNVAPPTFLLFLNREDLLAESYRKYLATELRRAFGFEGCPIIIAAKARPKTIESHRRHSTTRPPPKTRERRNRREPRERREGRPRRQRRG